MSNNIDKLIESLPDNLTFNVENKKITASHKLGHHNLWGPFEVDKTSVDLNQSQIWNNIRILNDGEWITYLIESSLSRVTPTANLDISDHEEVNITIMFIKKDSQIILSTNGDIEIGSELKCCLEIVDQFPSKGLMLVEPSLESDPNNEKMLKACKFCGINFSHQCTLEAHMTYYCSKRQTVLCETNPSPKCQKTWRTRQRNKQPNNLKSNSSDVPTFKSNVFCEEAGQFKLIDRGISSKLLIDAINGSDSHQIERQLNLNSQSIHPPIHNKSTLLTNGTSGPKNVLNVKIGESEKLSNKVSSNSDSEPENNNISTLGFCGPCGLFFSSKELYNIHIQLDVNNLQNSIAKCNSLVLAAPVFNNNGLQYVPIHPRTSMINNLNNIAQKQKPNIVEENCSSIPLDLSVNNASKSPVNLQSERAQLDVASRLAAAAGIAVSNCNHILKSNKRPFLCQHCQTRFQLYSTFQAHQEFYCQGKRQQLEISEKRCRTTSNNSSQNDLEPIATKSDDINWKICAQGFKCEGCGFIGQTKRGIRIHCKNQCFKRFPVQKSDNRCEEMELNSPTSDVCGGSNNATIALESPEHSDFCHPDSPMKIESV